MKGIFKFHLGLLRMPRIVQLWVAVLILMNLIVPLFFLGHLEAQVTIGVFLVGAVLLMLLTGMTGFTRLLGLGHILWFPLLAWLWLRVGLFPVDHWMGLWIRVLMMVNAASLIVDVMDVVRYVRGERAEVVEGL